MHHKDNTFRNSAVYSVILTGVMIQFHLLSRLTFIDELLYKEGVVSWVARLILWLTFWTFFALIMRWMHAGKERQMITAARMAVDSLVMPVDIDDYIQKGLPELWRDIYLASELRQRLALWKDRLDDYNRSDRLSFLTMAQSSIDSARLETTYAPLRAVVWALPSLGFMGTALEMARSIKGMQGLGNVDTASLLSNLMQSVIPALGGAFDITLFGLGSSVLCYLLLSIVHRVEQDVLHDADALSLFILAQIPDEQPELVLTDDTSHYLATGLHDLRVILQVLTWELNKLGSALPNKSASSR